MSTHDWTNVGADLVPEAERDAFLLTTGGATWVSPRGKMPMAFAESAKVAIREYRIAKVTAVSYDAMHGPAAVLGIRTERQAIWLIDVGTHLTPVLIETLPHPVGPLCGCGMQLPPSADLAVHREAAKCDSA